MSDRTTIVVPCFDEQRRLQPGAFVDLAEAIEGRVLFVDDGSRDATPQILAQLVGDHREVMDVVTLPRNAGKAEAVRHGLRAALHGGADLVGYYDADLATPVSEMVRLVGIARARPDLDALLAARVGLLGYDIGRSAAHHYRGRVFATISSVVLGLRVYDTQCGAKVLRDSAALRDALATPFRSRWAFDVELLGRLLEGPHPVARSAFAEVPLLAWDDKPGSKLTLRAALRATADLAGIARDLRLRRWRS